MSDRERLHSIIDTLPEFQLPQVVALLQPFEMEEEEIDEETRQALEAADADSAPSISLEEVKRSLGL
ncbi:MAG: hypothetical protein NTV70_09910 [Acidobacteria bacterium]|nr:hypothetical protein [Acidobacteriota bacterium]